MNEEFEMNKELRKIEQKILKRETNNFLEKIEVLMKEDGSGVANILSSKKENNKKENKGPGRSQFEMLMNAAEEASCIEELVLFISYQRSKKGGWEEKCTNGKDIAENLLNSFMEVQDDIYKKIKEEVEKDNIKISDEEKRMLELDIAKKYMGYLYWSVSTVINIGDKNNYCIKKFL